MRYALYFTPPHADLLTITASQWLGRDAFEGEMVEPGACGRFSSADLAALTQEPRRYGFHATLKAPFELVPERTIDELLAELAIFAAETVPFDIPSIVVGRLGPFFALVPDCECPALQDFAAQTVRRFEPFRAPLSDIDLARRKPDSLPIALRENLMKWGYPYVFDAFDFHMTLTGPVPQDKFEAMAALLQDVFAAFVNRPLRVSGIALFVEPERGQPFSVHSLMPLGGADNRKTA